jgi:hypothetical protein
MILHTSLPTRSQKRRRRATTIGGDGTPAEVLEQIHIIRSERKLGHGPECDACGYSLGAQLFRTEYSTYWAARSRPRLIRPNVIGEHRAPVRPMLGDVSFPL